MLAVSDTGCGMDEETRSPDLRALLHHQRGGQGHRLGSLHRIRDRRTERRQHLRLQRARQGQHLQGVLAGPPRSETRESESATRHEPRKGTETVLVVEDEAPVRQLVVRVLSRSGYRVLEAGSAGEVDGLLAGDCLFSTCFSPTWFCPEAEAATRWLKTSTGVHPGLPVIFMSGYTQDSAVFNGSLGAEADFLEKPFSPDRLLG